MPSLRYRRARVIDSFDPVNTQYPTNQGLIAWYLTVPHLFGGSYWYDLTGNYPAKIALASGSSWNAFMGMTPTYRPGGFGQLSCCDQTIANYVYATAQISAPITSFSFWCNAQTGTSGLTAYGGAFCQGTSDSNGFEYRRYSNNSYWELKSSGADNTVTSAIVDGTWHHHAVVKDVPNNQCRVYYDAALVATISGVWTTTGTVTIGSNNVPGRYISGAMDDIRIYNRLITASDILQVYRTPREDYADALNWR